MGGARVRCAGRPAHCCAPHPRDASCPAKHSRPLGPTSPVRSSAWRTAKPLESRVCVGRRNRRDRTRSAAPPRPPSRAHRQRDERAPVAGRKDRATAVHRTRYRGPGQHREVTARNVQPAIVAGQYVAAVPRDLRSVAAVQLFPRAPGEAHACPVAETPPRACVTLGAFTPGVTLWAGKRPGGESATPSVNGALPRRRPAGWTGEPWRGAARTGIGRVL